jgi:hypothetical protein
VADRKRCAFCRNQSGIAVAVVVDMLKMTCNELLFRGDVAIECGDREELGRVALQLSARIGDPLALQLVELARDCHRRKRGALAAWPRLRAAIEDRIAIAGT